MTAFPTRPLRNVGEGAIGYLMRLAEVHGVQKRIEALRMVEVPWCALAQGRGVNSVAAAAKLDAVTLAFDSGNITESGVKLRGETLRRHQWSVQKPRRACPFCFAEDRRSVREEGRIHLPRRWHRAWWDVRPLTVCVAHRVRLIENCRICGKPFNFQSTAVAKCPNGHAIDGVAAETVNLYAGDAYVLGRLGAAPRIGNVVLDDVMLGDAIAVMELAGTVDLSARADHLRTFAQHRILDAGFQVFADWPAPFDALLDRLLENAPTGPGRWGAAATYGQLHAALQKLRAGSAANAMKERIRLHAAKHGVVTSKPVFGVIAPDAGLCSLTTAAGLLGRGFDCTRAALAERGCLPDNTRRGTPILVTANVVAELAAGRREQFGPQRLAEVLKIGRSQARRLLESGMLGDGELDEQHVGVLLAKLRRGAPAKFDPAGAAGLPAACRTARCAIETAIAAVLDGRLKVVGIDSAPGLHGVLVKISALREIGKEARGTMTCEDAARHLSVKWETVRALVKLKLIAAEGTGITLAALETFKSRFVSGAVIAQRAGRSPRAMVEWLKKLGIKPVARPPACRQIFYRRADLLRCRDLSSVRDTITTQGAPR